MSLPKASTEEPRRHIQNVKIYIFLNRKQTKVSSGKGAGALPKHTQRSHGYTSRIQNIHFPNEKINKNEFGEGCTSPPKTHTEEPQRHIQNVKIYLFLIRKQTTAHSGKGA